MKLRRTATTVLALSTALSGALGDGLGDNRSENVRRIPPPGIAVPEDVRRELAEGAAKLGAELAALRDEIPPKSEAAGRWADAAVFQKAVDWAVRYGELYRTNEFAEAREQLRLGAERAASLRAGQAPWNAASGPVVRGYVSAVDGSVQPYGLVVPAGYDPKSGRRHRLDFWFHGRGEQLSELSFLSDRRRSRGEFAPADAFVLHLYGRYCNGSRFAGETDFWEALDDVRKTYPIDENRLVVRGFSLGGAACWHFTTHHAWRWAAAAPGAGFSETAEFLKVFQKEELKPAWWEQKLWRLYDSTTMALNTADTALVAYSGEVDSQRQAAEAMAKAMEAEGLPMEHIIGPKTAHAYEPGAKAEINRRIDALAAAGRDPSPRTVRFQTYSLRYNRMAWVVLDGLGEHWEEARVEARQLPESNRIELKTRNVTALELLFEPGEARFEPGVPITVDVDGAAVKGPAQLSDHSWRFRLAKEAGGWRAAGSAAPGLRKAPGLQGPIDDAFMAPFLFVTPTGSPLQPKVGAWAAAEAARAVEQWRRQYRGDVRQKPDVEVTDADRQAYNLVLWGDPGSNKELGAILPELPVKWSASAVEANGKSHPGDVSAAIFIYPNPRHPQHYVVVNSGFTFREYDLLNNARQTPKLPDWAVVDVSTPPDARRPGAIVEAGFFDERWRWK